jgi:hypothetical protein
VEQHKFKALIMLKSAACETAARGQLGGTPICCLFQPYRGTYLPALISAEEALKCAGRNNAVISMMRGPAAR